MKKIILTAAAIFAFGWANAQDTASQDDSFGMKKGDMWAEGALSIRSTKAGALDDVETSYSFTPKIGYMSTDEFAWGGYLNFSGGEYFNGDKFSNNGISVFGRWYGLSLGEKKSFSAYTELGLGYSKIEDDFSGEDDGELNAGLSVGMNYFLTKNLAVVFTLANIVSYNKTNPENGVNTDDVEVNINLFENIFDTPQFGLLYRW